MLKCGKGLGVTSEYLHIVGTGLCLASHSLGDDGFPTGIYGCEPSSPGRQPGPYSVLILFKFY